MKKAVAISLLACLIAFPIVAQNASVVRLSGKVEILGTGGVWTPAVVGQQLAIGATVSTGFQSQAVLAVGESQLTVLALTRMSIQQLLQTQTGQTTTLNLDTGKVRAQVRSAPGQSADFRLRSPVSTAAVRGTDFYFDGFRLDVIEGVVEFFNRLGQSQYVAAGNGSQTSGDDNPTNPEDDAGNQRVSGNAEGGGGTGGGSNLDTSGHLIIMVNE